MNFPPNPMSVQRTTGRQNRGAKEAGGWLKKRETHHTKSKKWNKRLPLPLPNSFVIHPSSSSTSPDGTSSATANQRRGEPTINTNVSAHRGKMIHGAGGSVPRLVGPKRRLRPLVLIPTMML